MKYKVGDLVKITFGELRSQDYEKETGLRQVIAEALYGKEGVIKKEFKNGYYAYLIPDDNLPACLDGENAEWAFEEEWLSPLEN